MDFGLPDPKRDPDRHQNCITWSLSHALPLQEISSKSVHKFASKPTDRQTNRQTNRPNQKHNLRRKSAEVMTDCTVVVSNTYYSLLLAVGTVVLSAVASLQCVSCVDDGCSSSFSLPSEYLGYTYEVLVWPPTDAEASFSVVTPGSASTSTRVRVTLAPGTARRAVEFGAVRLDCGQ